MSKQITCPLPSQIIAIFQSQFLKCGAKKDQMKKMKIFKCQFLNFFNAANPKKKGGSPEMYDKCYFCLDQLPKLKKESTASFFVNFGRSRGTKEPTYITVAQN